MPEYRVLWSDGIDLEVGTLEFARWWRDTTDDGTEGRIEHRDPGGEWMELKDQNAGT